MIYSSYDNVGPVRVLSLLKTHRDEYLSGQDLSDVLKISRVAVWKHIKKIRSLGYGIESKQNAGYRLTSDTDLLLPWEVTDRLRTKRIGRRAYYIDVADSTQDFASKIAHSPKEDGAVIIAGRQTHGRGRGGRKWASPRGGIWLSVVLNRRAGIPRPTLVPLAAAVALAGAIEETSNVKPSLKWPNDLLLGTKKVAGILVDASAESNVVHSMIIGIGINHTVDAAAIKRSMSGTSGYHGAASLLDRPRSGSAKTLVQRLLYRLEHVLADLDSDHKRIIKEWTARSDTIGRQVSITSPRKTVGRAAGIADDGALLVDVGGSTTRFVSGDIRYLR